MSFFRCTFGDAKRDTLPDFCGRCDVRFACHSECPKNRFATTPDGEPGLNYLCSGYKRFFTHIDTAMRFMASELAQQRAPANVMEWAGALDRQRAAGAAGTCTFRLRTRCWVVSCDQMRHSK